MFSLRMTDRILSLIKIVVLARILAPNDFGLMGIALLTMVAVQRFTISGFNAALIQKKENIENYLNTAWTVEVIRGFILSMVLYLSSPYVAIFFKTPDARLIIQVIGISVLLQSFTNIGIIYFQKKLEFNKIYIYQLCGTLADFTIAITLALIYKNVWALVFGKLAGKFVSVVMSYLLHPYRPRLAIDFEKIKELFTFGKWILGSMILFFLISHGGDIVIGKILGATMLGFYQIAHRISNISVTEITSVVSKVTYPAYSKLQGSFIKLNKAFLKVLQTTAFLFFTIAVFIFSLAEDITVIFLGEKWISIVPTLKVLAISGAVKSIRGTMVSVFKAIGKPKIATKWDVVDLFFLGVFVYPLSVKWGIIGTSYAVLLSSLISTIGYSFGVIQEIKCKFTEFFKMILFPLINGLVIVLLITFFKNNIDSIRIIGFLFLVSTGIFTTIITTFLFDKFFDYKILPLIKMIIAGFKKSDK